MGTRFKDPKAWFLGLCAGVFGAFWGAVESGLALPAIDSDVFNYGPGLHHTLKGIIIFAALSAVKVAATYLKQSPIPPIEITDTTIITQTRTTNDPSALPPKNENEK